MKKMLLLLCFIGCGLSVYGSQAPQQENKGLWSAVKSAWAYLNQNTGLENIPTSKIDFATQLANAHSPAERVEIQKRKNAIYKNGNMVVEGELFTHKLSVLKRPGTLIFLGLAFALWQGSTLVKDVAKHYLMLPPLARETSLRSWTDSVKGIFVYEEKIIPPRSEVILNDYLKVRTEVLTQSIINAAANDTFFRHYLFFGPPGTGKTMLAKSMAVESGLEYIIISGADLNQYSLEEGIKQIRHLFEFAKACPKKLMIVIDEADDLFAHRETCADKTRTFLNKILTYTGTEQSDFMVLALSNRPRAFDKASLSRFGEKLKIGAPELTERKLIFAQYAQKYLIDSHTVNRDNRTFYQWFFTPKPKERLPLYVAEDVFTDEVFTELGKQSEGLVGRDIADVMLTVQNAAYATHDQTITKDILYAALEVKKQQLEEIKHDFEEDIPYTVSAAPAA